MKENSNRKNYLDKKFLLLAILCLTSIGTMSENVVDIDLNADTIVATENLEVDYGNVKLNVKDLKRDKEKNKLYINKPFDAKLNDPTGRGYIDAKSGEMTLDGKNGDFNDAFGYLEVGKSTGAEYPNDKVYYGGNKVNYREGNATIYDGWFTTDPKIKKTKNPKEVGYHLTTDSTYIEQDKQITMKGIDLYTGDKSYVPFEFPWYRFNIRKGSSVPLFPSIGSSTDYGNYITWGALWGNKDSKYKGGFAPKYSDEQGFLIGRMENWYETKDYGDIKFNINDMLIHKKNSDIDDRYETNLTHTYSGNYGISNMSILNTTHNMIDDLDDIMNSYSQTNAWKTLGIKEVKPGDNTQFYGLNTLLTGIGKDKDITLNANIKQVSDRDVLDVMVFDQINNDEDSILGSERTGAIANSILTTDLSLYKDNSKYRIGGYYKNLYDLTPGSSSNEAASKNESYGFEFYNKEKKLKLNYDLSRGDKYRSLGFMEGDSNLTPWLFSSTGQKLNNTLTGSRGSYTMYSIPEYNTYDSEKASIIAGEYGLGKTDVRAGYDLLKIENELSTLKDPFRMSSIKGNERDKEFNRYNNIVYEKTIDNRGWVEFSTDNYALTLGGGDSKTEFWNREGIYNFKSFKEGDAYKIYKRESNFADAMLEKKRFETQNFGDIRLYAGLRYDDYTKGSVTGINKDSLVDSSLRTQLGFDHYSIPYSKEDNEIKNTLSYGFQKYNEENTLLEGYNNFNKIKDTVDFSVKDTNGQYVIDYNLIDNAATGDKKNQLFNNKLNLNFSDIHNLSLNYGTNKRYTNENISEKNKNDLTYGNYGLTYNYNSHRFNYNGQKIDSDIWNINNTDNSSETIKVNNFGYSYGFKNKDRLGINYTLGSDKRKNFDLDTYEIDKERTLYGISYFDYGPRYENTYSASFGETKYGHNTSSQYSTDTYNFGYTFLDKSMDQEFLKDYAMKEYDKNLEEINSIDLDNAAALMKSRAQQGKSGTNNFNLASSWKRPVAFTGDYNRKFSFSTYMEKNKDKYDKTEDFWGSLQQVGVVTGYSQRRVGIGYTYSEEVLNPSLWSDKSKEHTLSLNVKVGKPSEGYRVTTYAKFENDWFKGEKQDGLAKTYGIELGKEMGYYEWSIAYLQEYNYGDRDYDWKVALQFSLLTFPDVPIFGLGAKQSSGANSSPGFMGSVMSGIKASDVEIDN